MNYSGTSAADNGESVSFDELTKTINALKYEARLDAIKIRLDAAKILGVDDEGLMKIKPDTVFILRGNPDRNHELPAFIRFSPVVEKGAVYMARQSDIEFKPMRYVHETNNRP